MLKKEIKLKNGRTGIIRLISGENAIVELDGFEEEKRKAKEFEDKYGEGPNVVSWIIEVKKSDIQGLV